MRRFLSELRRRQIYKFGVIYLALAWLLTQIAISIEEPLGLPGWVDTFVIILLAIGFPVVMLAAWAHDSKPGDGHTANRAHSAEIAGTPRDERIVRGEIRFCRTPGGLRLAYRRSGQGPPLLRTGNWLSHQELEWEISMAHPLLRDLSREFELVTYDGRGTGLSDREVDEFSLETMVEDMEVIADHNRLDRFAIFALSQSCAVSIAYAVRHPERVSHMVLYGGFARNFRTQAEVDAIATLFAQNWGQADAGTRQMFTSSFFPDASKEEFDEFNEWQRHSIAPEGAARLFRACHAIDVREEATRVSVPTLVLHSRGDVGVNVEYGREIASLIPGAQFTTIDSKNHIVLEREPAYAQFVREIVTFIKDR